MKKLLFTLLLIPYLAGAFPVYTNRLEFDPAQSTGAFDDFLWRWSGFDDQRAEFLFKDVTVSNVGFRLAYPQRGKTFLDVFSTATQTTIVTEVFDVYTTRYPRITYNVETNGFTNVLIRKFIVDGTFSREETTSVARATTRQVLTASEATAIIYTQTAPSQLTSPYGIVTNTTAASTNYVLEQTIRQFTTNYYRLGQVKDTFVFTPTQNNDSVSYGIPAPSPLSGQRIFYGLGIVAVTNFTTGAEFTQTNSSKFASIQLNFGTSLVEGVVLYVYATKSGQTNFTLSERRVVNSGGSLVTVTNTVAFSPGGGGLSITSTPSGVLRDVSILPYSRNTETSIQSVVYSLSTPASNVTIHVRQAGITYPDIVAGGTILSYNVTNFNLSYNVSAEGFLSTTNTISADPILVYTSVNAGSSAVVENYPATLRSSSIYKRTESLRSRVVVDISRTNIPPDGPYFAEVLTYSGASPTNATQTRTLAKGQVTVENSIWAVTNYAGYTNYPGPWDYLLRNGSRPMQGNLNMGGYAVTNIGGSGLVFSNGVSITSSNVNLWNSFIAGTGASLTASTVFDGNVTGLYNNLTLRKNALDEMQFVDFTLSPTGTVSEGRMQWNASRSTLKLGLNANADLDVGQQLFVYAKSIETNTISKGEVVYVAGASGDNPTIKRASNASEATSARTIGIAAENVASNNNGLVVTRGTIYNVNTTNFTQGAALYLGVNGTLQTNLPVAPIHGVFIGTVERVGQNNGQIYVAVQNYQELEELSDVNVRSAATNDFLIWSGTVWTNYARTNLNSIYLPLAGGTMSGDLDMDGQDIDVARILNNGTAYIDLENAEFFTPWAFNVQPTIPGYLTSAGAASTYVQLTNLSAIAGSGLGVTANQLVVTNVSGVSTNYLELGGGTMRGAIDFTSQSIDTNATNFDAIYLGISTNRKGSPAQHISRAIVFPSRLVGSSGLTNTVATNKLYASGSDLIYERTGVGGLEPTPVYSVTTNTIWHSGNFNASSYLTISAANSNYWRITTVPTSNSSFGQRGEMAVDSTNVFIYNPNALGTGTGRWIRISGSVSW